MDNPEEQASNKHLAGVNQFREMLYLFLSRAFSKEADQAFLQDSLKILNSLEDLSDLVEISQEEDIQNGKRLLREFFKEIEGREPEKVLIDLSRDYAASFLGIGGKTVALCESVYHGQSESLFQESYFEVKERYMEIGLEKSKDFTEPDDHLSVELAHMANLCRLIIGSDENGTEQLNYLRAQQKFMQKHLISWVPAFFESLREVNSSIFYRSLGYILNGYIKVDASLIYSLIEEVQSLK